MSTSFARLLRDSRLASYDRTISQVYTTPLKNKKIGDWGLKRNLPTVIRTRYATIEQLDTAEHQTPWNSANDKVLFVKRWKENFPHSKKPMPRSDRVTVNVMNMTPGEFDKFLKSISEKSDAFNELMKQKEVTGDQVFDYLNVRFNDTVDDTPVGPTYSEYTVTDQQISVEGRILNSEKYGHAVGVAGIVAFLPKRNSMNLRHLGNKRVRTFYVESAEIDDEGKPRVVLNTVPPGTASLPFMIAFEEEDTNDTMSARDMFLIKNKSIGRIKEDTEAIKPNPDHEQLMNRITSLIQKSK
ncbi:hypothetical protein BDB01DRAFT_794786 [Pilobolus umbonatus]|nr:hypothetical protein BDB01DRAFT_794786 [Pilobolus umbonatus]